MELLEKNQDLTPFKLCLCILLYEGLSNSKITSVDRGKILNLIIKHVQNSQGIEISYSDLLETLEELLFDPLSESPKQILVSRLNSMTEFSDVLHLFIVKLNELKSDGEINNGCLEQGGILYLFLRKCFVNFARMGFEDLVRLHKQLEEYKSNKPLKPHPKILASQIAGSLQKLILNESYEELSKKIGSLNNHSKYLLQGHLDAHYNKDSAIDNIHRYFDLVLDQQIPTKTTREKGLVVVQSSTHFASLHRVKIELQLNHLEAAVHLLVETIKRALSENDNLVIVESTLLFMKIAGMMGNYKQEKRISQKSVLHALKLENTNALIQSTLLYSQLHLLYSNTNSAHILAEIQPKPEIKLKNPLQPTRRLVLDEKVSTWCNLCDYTLLQSLLSHEHQGLAKKLNFINAISWLNQGYDWNFELNIESLKNAFECSISEADYYLELSRILARHNKPKALELLKMIDAECKQKECIKWVYTLCYFAHIKSLQSGEFFEAEYLEETAIKAKGDVWEVKLLKLERLVMEKSYKIGFELGNELIDYFDDKGLQLKLCLTRILLSLIYLNTKEYFRSLAELNKCLEIVQNYNSLEIPVKLAMAETSLQAFENPLISLNILNSIETKIFNVFSPMYLGKFYKSKAKVLLALAKSLNEPYEAEIFRKSLSYLELAEEEFLKDNCLWESREVYYILARVYNMMGDSPARDFYSDKFFDANKEINVNSKSTYKRDQGISLDIIID